jgi:putative lipoprotein
MHKVTGTVTYLSRIALPPDSVVVVRLVDVSRADAPADLIAEQRIATAGKQVPIGFELAYDPAAVDPRRIYAVQARIELQGQLRFISDRRYEVVTGGRPSNADLVLVAVGGTGPR